MFVAETTDTMLYVRPHNHALRGHELAHRVAAQHGPMFNLWLVEMCHNHDVGVKTETINLAKSFMESGDKKPKYRTSRNS